MFFTSDKTAFDITYMETIDYIGSPLLKSTYEYASCNKSFCEQLGLSEATIMENLFSVSNIALY